MAPPYGLVPSGITKGRLFNIEKGFRRTGLPLTSSRVISDAQVFSAVTPSVKMVVQRVPNNM